MSWLVETIIRDRLRILEKPNLDSDEYNNLLIVEKKIAELVKIGTIDIFELAILEYVSSQQPYVELEKLLGISRNTLAEYFKRICGRVSYALGGIFTDEGFLEYMRVSNRLTEEQVEKMREHINSKYRHTIRR